MEPYQENNMKNLKWHLYASPPYKVSLALTLSFYYLYFCFKYSEYWINDITEIYNYPIAILIVFGIALIPGFMNCFIFFGLLFDKKPKIDFTKLELPPISILVAAYNEEENIQSTLESLTRQEYPNKIQCIIINDGSTDKTYDKIREFILTYDLPENIIFKPLNLEKNVGKANALNEGLKKCKYENIITVDGDSWLYKDALSFLVGDFISSNNVAMAGSILVKNSRNTWMTKFQEQDYFYSISAVKRTQHLCGGVLVAQGALSIYKKSIIEECNGWKPVVGEDIILSWDMLNRGYSIGHSERSICWTNAPETYKQYFNQRKRWARGMIEAFKSFPFIMFKPKLHSIFIWFNLFFPVIDFFYLFVFVPSIIMALIFKYYLLVSMMTLLLLPFGFLMNFMMFNAQIKVFKYHGLKIRKHYFWIFFYFIFGNLLSCPSSLAGYLAEITKSKKSWGTK